MEISYASTHRIFWYVEYEMPEQTQIYLKTPKKQTQKYRCLFMYFVCLFFSRPNSLHSLILWFWRIHILTCFPLSVEYKHTFTWLKVSNYTHKILRFLFLCFFSLSLLCIFVHILNSDEKQLNWQLISPNKIIQRIHQIIGQ